MMPRSEAAIELVISDGEKCEKSRIDFKVRDSCNVLAFVTI